MINQRIERFLKQNNLSMSPKDIKKTKKEAYTKRKFSSSVFTFHDTSGIEHYMLNNKNYLRKTLTVNMAYDQTTKEYPSRKRISNLKNIIRTYTKKPRILSEKTVNDDKKFEIIYEILFTSNNNLKSYQYWINELAYEINDNSSILLEELSLTVTNNPHYRKIIPTIDTNQFINRKKEVIYDNMDKLSDFELAIISDDYKKDGVLPPYELAVDLEFSPDFFKENEKYYKNERTYYAYNFLENVRHAKVLKEARDYSSIRWY